MTLRVRVNTEIPLDTYELVRKLLPVTDPYRVIGDQLRNMVRDEDFAKLYESTGRYAVWPSMLALVAVFRFQEDLPDRETAEMVTRRIDWKYALHLPLDYPGFHFTDLHTFRQRLLDNEQAALVFDALLSKIQAWGVLKKRGKQRMDSTHIVGVVQELARLELVTETLRMTLREIKAVDEAWTTRVLPVAFCETYLERRQDYYRLSDAERQAALRKTGQDGFWPMEQIDRDAPKIIRELGTVQTLHTIWEQPCTLGMIYSLCWLKSRVSERTLLRHGRCVCCTSTADPVEQLPLATKQMIGAQRAFVFADETCQRLPELALLGGTILPYYAAAVLPAIPTGFWDRIPQPTPGRLRRCLARVGFPADFALPPEIRGRFPAL